MCYNIYLIYRAPLGDRLELEEDAVKVKLAPSAGSREMTFTLPQVAIALWCTWESNSWIVLNAEWTNTKG